MRRGGFHALFLESCWSHEAKKRWLFLSHDAAPHFETLPHRNSQQNKERRHWSALKTHQEMSFLGRPGLLELLPRQTRRLPAFMWTLSPFRHMRTAFHTVVFVFVRLFPAGLAKAGHGWLAMACYWRSHMLLFAEVRISVSTIYGSEDIHGFPYPENYLEIGPAMLSLVR